MAGTIIADYIRSDANRISLNVGNTIVASVNAMGILSNTGNVMISSAGAITANNISLGRIVTPSVMPTGSVLQVVQASKTDTWTATTGAGYSAVTGFSVAITPTSSTSKILVMMTAHASSYTYHIKGVIKRNGTVIVQGDTAGSRPRSTFTHIGYAGGTANDQYHIYPITYVYLDSPATTSSCTYTLELGSYNNDGASGWVGFNRSYQWQDGGAGSGYDGAPASTWTVMEIAG